MPRSVELNQGHSATKPIDVIVGIVSDSKGRILIGRRPEGTHMAGNWEFPGGKLNPGESPLSGLKRELAEELGIEVEQAEPFVTQEFQYPDRLVRLDVWWVLAYSGDAAAREGQALSWVAAADLDARPLLPADAPIVAAIRERLG